MNLAVPLPSHGIGIPWRGGVRGRPHRWCATGAAWVPGLAASAAAARGRQLELALLCRTSLINFRP